MSFVADLQKLVKIAGDRADLVVKKVSLDLFTSLVMESPVDQGRFRGNWHVGAGVSQPLIRERFDKDGGSTIGEGTGDILQIPLGVTIYMTNNLPYGPRLERGWSQKAPQGMVRITVARFNQFVEKAARSRGSRVTNFGSKSPEKA